MLRCAMLLCLLFVSGAAGYAQSPAQAPLLTTCPWLTQGSAVRMLGGDVSVAVHVSDAGEGSCNFVRKQEPGAFLKIEVSKAALPSCGADSTKLRGIGNEAMRCRLAGSSGKDAEMISSRVRDLHFTLTLALQGKDSAASSADVQQDAFERIAEQVAGNLF